MAKVRTVSPAMEALVVGHTTEVIWAILLVAKLIGSARSVGRSILPRPLKIWLKARLAGAGLLLD